MKQVYGIFTKITTVDPDDSGDVTEYQDFLIVGYGVFNKKSSAEKYAKKYNKELWLGAPVYYVLPLPMD